MGVTAEVLALIAALNCADVPVETSRPNLELIFAVCHMQQMDQCPQESMYCREVEGLNCRRWMKEYESALWDRALTCLLEDSQK